MVKKTKDILGSLHEILDRLDQDKLLLSAVYVARAIESIERHAKKTGEFDEDVREMLR